MIKSDSKRKMEGKYKEKWVGYKVCVEVRREHAREGKSETDRRNMLEGIQGNMSAQGRQGRAPLGKEKHMQQEMFTREWESMSRRKAKHIQKSRKTCQTNGKLRRGKAIGGRSEQ